MAQMSGTVWLQSGWQPTRLVTHFLSNTVFSQTLKEHSVLILTVRFAG